MQTTSVGGAPTGVLLLNMGGPWSLDDVRPFLLELFNDRDIIAFPGGPALQKYWASMIARFRTPKVLRRYAAIGGGSPLLKWTLRQSELLAARLNAAGRAGSAAPSHQAGAADDPAGGRGPSRGGRFVTAVAMRYAPPRAAEALRELRREGYGRIVVLPLYPQECHATTGSSLADLDRTLARINLRPPMIIVRSFHDHPGYIEALARAVRDGHAAFPDAARGEAVTLFSAHGVPQRLADAGDPYVDQVRATVTAVVDELGTEIGEHRLSFQSRTGPVRWVGPGTDEVLKELGQTGRRSVLVVPISFVSDHIETLHEIDIEFAELAREAGIVHFRRSPALNDRPDFIAALADIVLQAVNGAGTHKPAAGGERMEA
ncbi:MAG: ferrochelatase [Candidatus Eisenbacteria bacterium]|nr:ferrochelatase [Candidatus Eisenbacteria bacterium]